MNDSKDSGNTERGKPNTLQAHTSARSLSERIAQRVRRLRSNAQLLGIRFFIEPFVTGPYQRRVLPVLFGPIYFQALSAAVRMDLFTKLAKKRRLTLAEISSELSIQPKQARVLVDVLVALGLIKRCWRAKDGQPCFRNGWLTTQYLSTTSEYRVNAIVEWYHHIVYKPMFHFHEALRTGQNVGLKEISGGGETLYERLVEHPELEKIFQDAMQQISHLANRSLAEFVDLSDVKKLIDVGGGNGSNIIALAKRHEHLQAMVFDSASVREIALNNIATHGLDKRLSALTGNCFSDPYPEDADCYLYCHFMDIWSEEQNRMLIEKTYAALPQDGKIMVFDIMQNDNGKGPLTAAAGHPYFLTLATGDGFIYSAGEYEQWIREAGFSQVWRVYLPQDHVVVIGRK